MGPTKHLHMSSTNRIDLLNIIRREGMVSIDEIMNITGCGRDSVLKNIARLIEENLIIKTSVTINDTSNSKKKRAMLILNCSAAFVVGIHITRSALICVIIDFKGEVKNSLGSAFQDKHMSISSLTDQIEDTVTRCVEGAGLRMEQITAAAVAVPGLIDHDKKKNYASPFQDRVDNLQNLIQARFKIPIHIENNATAAACFHKWFGAGRNSDEFILISLEESVEMAMILNSGIHRASSGLSGDFGHTVVVPGGIACVCGKRGCIDAYAGAQAIINAAQESLNEGEWRYNRSCDLCIEELIEIAGKEEAVEDIFRRAGAILGIGIAGLIQSLCPSKIVFSGTCLRAGKLIFNPMQEALERYVGNHLLGRVEIIPAEYEQNVYARGAGLTALAKIGTY